MTLLEWLDHGGPSWLEWVDPRNIVPHCRLALGAVRRRRAERRRGIGFFRADTPSNPENLPFFSQPQNQSGPNRPEPDTTR